MYDDSCDGTWLLMKNTFSYQYWNAWGKNHYESSSLHYSYLNGTVLSLFDSSIQSDIKQVKIPYVTGTGYSANMGVAGNDAAVASGVNGLSTKIFLLSGYEIGYTQSVTSQYLPVDGACLSYFSRDVTDADIQQGSSNNRKRIADSEWWLRSRAWNLNIYDNYGWVVVGSGVPVLCPIDAQPYAVRPALILPKTNLVADNGTVLS